MAAVPPPPPPPPPPETNICFVRDPLEVTAGVYVDTSVMLFTGNHGDANLPADSRTVNGLTVSSPATFMPSSASVGGATQVRYYSVTGTPTVSGNFSVTLVGPGGCTANKGITVF